MKQDDEMFGLLKHCDRSALGTKLQALELSFGRNTTKLVAMEFLQDKTFLQLMGTACVFIGLTCLVLNMFTFTYYCKVKKQMFNTVYRSLTLCDMINGVAAILMGCNLMYYCTWDVATLEASPPDIGMTKLVVAVSSLMSRVAVWNNLLLTILRTQTVSIPAFKISSRALNLMLIIQPACWIVVTISDISLEQTTGMPLLYYIRYDVIKTMLGRMTIFKASFAMCVLPPSFVVWSFVLVIPFVLPVCIALPLMISQVYYLMFRNRQISSKSTRSKKMTITIIYLTIVYILCNSVYFIAIVTTNSISLDGPPYESLLFITSTVVPYLHSTINASILIGRGRSLQNYCLTVLDRYMYRWRRVDQVSVRQVDNPSNKNMTTCRLEKEGGIVSTRNQLSGITPNIVNNVSIDLNHLSIDNIIG